MQLFHLLGFSFGISQPLGRSRGIVLPPTSDT
nr:MAG TPA: hypothetical protein [Inoviridae sp.]DAU25709.1 MAG TPA: hypothetical protein [Inoviridae sp.]DAV53253.1 MAG TPA: hypothetical protein [Inoviridae sp.]